jgi:hypothetical protein
MKLLSMLAVVLTVMNRKAKRRADRTNANKVKSIDRFVLTLSLLKLISRNTFTLILWRFQRKI